MDGQTDCEGPTLGWGRQQSLGSCETRIRDFVTLSTKKDVMSFVLEERCTVHRMIRVPFFFTCFYSKTEVPRISRLVFSSL